MKERMKRLQKKLKAEELDAVLITNPENRYYLTGFTGTAGAVLLTTEQGFLITDFRYTTQAKEQTKNYKIIEQGDNRLKTINKLLLNCEIEKLAFESETVSYHKYNKYQEQLEVELAAVTDLVEELRQIKDETELEKINKAVKITDSAFAKIKDKIEVGVREKDISLELEFFQKRLGAAKNAFDFIVASGIRSALPHGVASNKPIEQGDFVTMDFGAVYHGYHSDMTRTVVVGAEPTKKQQQIYNLVLEAQQAAIAAIEPGKTGQEIDKVARDIISEAGYSANFGHGLGHSVGLEIHEKPRLSRKDETVLEEGMVVTVEPGVYIPEWGGVRIEDIVVVTEDGCRILTKSTKELLVLE
ncbi:MAG: M24 family metallopeptidase [Bacillota bacterium]